jgi:hypothetical protein
MPPVRRRQLRLIVPLSDTTVYMLEMQGRFPRQRSILPQALAIHLAKDGLNKVLPSRMSSAFADGPTRLRKSFARRLGFLHGSPQAEALADRLLEPSADLAPPEREDKEALEVLTFLAPIVPRRTLEILQA